LKHQGFADFMARNFDYWVVIEGLTRPGGSTGWCRDLQLPSRSDDGSHEFMMEFSDSHANVVYFSPGVKWNSKDDMVNEAMKVVKMWVDECLLWQVDVDEIWKASDLIKAENELIEKGAKAGCFQFNHYICKRDDGVQLIGRGEWGSGFNTRLFHWRKVIENATEIHCIDSSLANFVEVIRPECKVFFYRVEARNTESLFDFNYWQLVEPEKQLQHANS